MALRGTNNGGFSFALPAGYDDTRDLSLFLWLHRAGTPDAADRVLTLTNSARTRGLQLTMGGSTLSAAATDLVLSLGSGGTSSWGVASGHDGRGRFTTGPLSSTAFEALAVSVRGSAASDNSGSGGAQQIHQLWWNGVETAPNVTGTGGAAPPSPGGGVSLLVRDGTTANYFDGWIAEVAVWQDYRLSAADVAALVAGGAALAIAPDKLLFYRPLRTTTAAVVGDAALTTLGTAPVIDTANHPPVRVAPADARHDHAVASAALTPVAAPPVLSPVPGLHGHHAVPASLMVAGTLTPASTRHAQQATAGGLVPPAVLHAVSTVHGHTATPASLALPGWIAPLRAVQAHRASLAALLTARGYGELWLLPGETRLTRVETR